MYGVIVQHFLVLGDDECISVFLFKQHKPRTKIALPVSRPITSWCHSPCCYRHNRDVWLHFKIYEEQSLRTINTDVLAGKLNGYVILIQDRDSRSGSEDSPALPRPKPNRSLIAASVSRHNLTAIRRFHSVGVKQQSYRPNRNTIRHTNDCRQNRTRVRPAERRAVKQLFSINVNRNVCSHMLMFKSLLNKNKCDIRLN